MQLGQDRVPRYGHFSIFLTVYGLKMANIAPFGLKIGLPINLDLNDGQNKNKVHMFKVVAKNPNNGPKIGQLPLLSPNFTWA